jgi:nucleoside-diphosphate-sugar epimerase
MRILIAGVAGYIGPALVPKLLDRGDIETLKLLSANNGLGSLAEGRRGENRSHWG